jgi:hypothetical protein
MGCRDLARVDVIEDFNALYAAGTPAWDIGRPQPAFRELADHSHTNDWLASTITTPEAKPATQLAPAWLFSSLPVRLRL